MKVGDLVRVPDVPCGTSTDPALFGKVGIVVEIPVPSEDFITGHEEVIVLIDYLRSGLQELWFDRTALEILSESR